MTEEWWLGWEEGRGLPFYVEVNSELTVFCCIVL